MITGRGPSFHTRANVTLAYSVRNDDCRLLIISGKKGTAESADGGTHSNSRSRDNHHGRQLQTRRAAGRALQATYGRAGNRRHHLRCDWLSHVATVPCAASRARYEAVQPGSVSASREPLSLGGGGGFHKSRHECERNLGITTRCAGYRTSPVHGGFYSSPIRPQARPLKLT